MTNLLYKVKNHRRLSPDIHHVYHFLTRFNSLCWPHYFRFSLRSLLLVTQILFICAGRPFLCTPEPKKMHLQAMNILSMALVAATFGPGMGKH